MRDCDHTSVGVLIRREGKLLLIQRANIPFGWAPPAGHQDGDTPRRAAVREVREETGLIVRRLRLVHRGRKKNECRRGGYRHDWRIYEATVVTRDVHLNKREALDANWLDAAGLDRLANRTDTRLQGRLSAQEWALSPGLELVWCEWFKKLGVIQ